MKQEHYPSLELCKKLTEIGFPKTQHTYSFWWDKCEEEFTIVDEDDDGVSRTEFYRCPSVMEMLDVIPDHIAHEEDEWKGWDYAWQGWDYAWQLLINKRVINIGYDVFYNRLIQEPFNLHKSDTDTLPNALAQMILWLHENKYISFN